jgi:hypothetical protein
MDHLIESLDVGLGHYGSEDKVSPVGANNLVVFILQ